MIPGPFTFAWPTTGSRLRHRLNSSFPTGTLKRWTGATWAPARANRGDGSKWVPIADRRRFYRLLTVDNAGGPAKTDYQVRIDLHSGNFDWAETLYDGIDIEITSFDGTITYSCWVEKWEKVNKIGLLWFKIPSLAAGASVQVRMYHGNVNGATQNVNSVFTFAETFNDNALIGTLDDSVGFFPGNQDNYLDNPIVSFSGTREQSNVVYRPNAPDGEQYSILYTINDQIYVIFSKDGKIWSAHDSVIRIPNAEDPYVTLNIDGTPWTDASGRMHVHFERKNAGDQVDNGVARTSDFKSYEVWDGTAWTTTVTNHAIVLPKGASGTWDELFTGSPTVIFDGTQHVCLYEGSTAALLYRTGVAFSSNGVNWTKGVNNPISTLEVIDEIIKIGSTYWFFGHDAGAYTHRLKTMLAPSAWDSASALVFDDPFPWGGAGSSLSLFHDGSGRLTYYPPDLSRLDLFDILGGATWKFQHKGFVAFAPQNTEVGVTNGILTMQDRSSGSQMVMRTKSDSLFTSDFAVRARIKGGSGTAAHHFQLSVGNGALTTGFGPPFGTYGDGVGYQNDAGTWRIRGYTANDFTGDIDFDAAPGFTVDAWNVHELRYRASNPISVYVNDTLFLDGAHTANATTNKGILLSVAPNGNASSEVDVDFVLVRKFDGVDPTVLVGAAVAA